MLLHPIIFQIERILIRSYFFVANYLWGKRKKSKKKLYVFTTGMGVGDLIYFRPYAKRIREFFSAEEYEYTLFSTYRFPEKSFYEDQYVRIYSRKELWNVLLHHTQDPEIQICITTAPAACQKHYSFFQPAECCILQFSLFADWKDYFPFDNAFFIDTDNQTIEKRYADLIAGITGKPEPLRFPDWSDVPVPAQKIQGKYFVFCPGAMDPQRCWPKEKFAETADFLVERYGCNIYFTGSSKERNLIESIIALCKTPKYMKNIAGETDLAELFSLVKHAKLLVSNETGTAHIAIVVKTKVVIILGCGDYGTFLPCLPGNGCEEYVYPVTVKEIPACKKCIWRNETCKKTGNAAPCIRNIAVSDVKTAIISVLSRGYCSGN